MAMRLFADLVNLVKIKLAGKHVKFVIDERTSGFLFKKHNITELNVPRNLVNDKLVEHLGKQPKLELKDIDMVLGGRATGMSGLK